MFGSDDQSPPTPLPPPGVGLLLRALFKRPRPRTGGAVVPVAPLASRFLLDAPDRAHVARYNAALGFAPGAMPLSYWYLPVQRAHLVTMLDAGFPYRIAGIVHVENALQEYARTWQAPLCLDTRVETLAPSASGAVYCQLETRARAAGAPVFTCTSKYLVQRGRPGGRAGQARADHAAHAGAEIGRWPLGPAAGRDYARVSGDWNPIHLSRWTARLMGLRAPIIHGMHSVAKACALLEAAHARPVTTISVRFQAPVPLGSTLVLTSVPEEGRYALYNGDVVAASGAYALAGAGMKKP